MPDIEMIKKQAISGVKGLMAYPVMVDTEEEYKVGTGYKLPTVQEVSADADLAENTIHADDAVYFKAREERGATLTFTLAELPLELQAQVEGGSYDDILKKYTFPLGTPKPTLAFRNISHFVDNSGYRVEYAAVCDVLSVEYSGNKTTRGDNVEITPVNLIVYSKPRKVDGVRVVTYEPKDSAGLAAAEADFIAGVLAAPVVEPEDPQEP